MNTNPWRTIFMLIPVLGHPWENYYGDNDGLKTIDAKRQYSIAVEQLKDS